MKTILIGLTFIVLAGATFAANLVIHVPHNDGIDPLKPIRIVVAVS